MKEKDFTLEHTKPLFTRHKFLTVKNLYNLHTIVELFKILKYHRPYPLFENFQSSYNCNSNLLRIPCIKLDLAKQNFIFSSSSIWNSVIDKVYSKLQPSTVKISGMGGMYSDKMIIPGSSENSDLSTSIGYFKSKTRTLLNQLQCKGDLEEWDDRNFNTKFLEGPSWTWGLDNN